MRPQKPNGSELIAFKTTLGLLLLLLFFSFVVPLYGQRPKKDQADTTRHIRQTQKFYDSVYHKFSRSQVTRMMYDLAFTKPEAPAVTDSVQKITGESPFTEHEGKLIRNIRILTMDPFGPTITDTSENARTGMGKGLNTVHITTQKYIIRRNLLFKKGDAIDPGVMADNERILREMSFIDNAHIIISPAGPASDSVDLTVVTKDVWSIGFDIINLTSNKATARIYDGNFLGLGDRLTTTMSAKINRKPFFRFDGVSYTYTNIAGSFINAGFDFYQDDAGNMNVGAGFHRNFFSNKTKWAGGAIIDFYRDVNQVSDTHKIISRYRFESLYFGWAFQLKKQRLPSRFVIMQAAYRKQYSERPEVTLATDNKYFNKLLLLTSFSLSKNNYYLTDYLMKFGKTENVPYGYLFQMTIGPEYSDFYDRFYTGFEASGGNFFPGPGYFAGTLKLGGYFRQSLFEDAVLKANLRYISYLYVTDARRYKFRYFVNSDYKMGFNFRDNNFDYANINREFQIKTVRIDSLFYGIHSLSLRLSAAMYTPWYFYGFKFSLLGQLQCGVISPKMNDLFRRSIHTGMGLGLLIKNDNLIFPTFLVNLFYYPNSPEEVPPVQLQFIQNAEFTIPDFNVPMPRTETLGN